MISMLLPGARETATHPSLPLTFRAGRYGVEVVCVLVFLVDLAAAAAAWPAA